MLIIPLLQIPMGYDNPRRIAYQPTLKMYGVACLRMEAVRLGEFESITSSFKVFDDASFTRKLG
jgi:DNA damage-binding protein 1